MEQNLSKLLNQHQSMPQLHQEEPVDPFQKAQFGKRMRKSKIHQRASPSQEEEMPSFIGRHRDVSFEQVMPSKR
jgi:hypothetical protein